MRLACGVARGTCSSSVFAGRVGAGAREVVRRPVMRGMAVGQGCGVQMSRLLRDFRMQRAFHSGPWCYNKSERESEHDHEKSKHHHHEAQHQQEHEHQKEGGKHEQEPGQSSGQAPKDENEKAAQSGEEKEVKKEEEEKEAKKEEKKEEVKKEEDPRDLRIAELNRTVVELRQSIKLALADVENTRKRLQKDVDKAKDFGVEKLVKNLLSVTDTINICLQNKPQLEGDENTDAKIAFDALEATKKQILAIFKDSYGIEEFVPAIGDTFDPMKHNALFEVDPPEGQKKVPPGTIGLVVKSGWARGSHLLRAAAVGVVKHGETADDLEDDLSLD